MANDTVRRPELFFGLVGAVGTDLKSLSEMLCDVLRSFGYSSTTLHVIELLKHFNSIDAKLAEEPVFKRYMSRMDAGDEFRRTTGRNDALALLAARGVQKVRAEQSDDGDPVANHAYLFRSLKTPEEVESLRKIYGPGFFLIGAYAPKTRRRDNLTRQIAGSTFSDESVEVEQHADVLIHRDEKEKRSFGQNVRDTFPLSDFFVDVTQNRGTVRSHLERFLSLVFGHPFTTPTPDENAMFHAQSAALRSAEMGRQVGAVLTNDTHSIIAVGTNEVPKAGGGQYWATDESDRRTFQLDRDTSDELKLNNVAQIMDRLRDEGWLAPERATRDRSDLIKDAAELLRGTRVMSPIEYGRAVHAEMSALMDAARRGCSVQDSVLYCTAFPCHNCTRHIVNAGVRRVVYIEPYAKSLAETLHREALVVEGEGREAGKIDFVPFVGVAPRQYLPLFTMVERKQSDGRRIPWDKLTALPRTQSPPISYVENEDAWGALLREVLIQTEFSLD